MANLQLIKYFAEKRGISIRDLAEKIGIKENQIHVMCRTNSTRIDTLEKIAHVLNISISEFFDDFSIEKGNIINGNYDQLNAKCAHNNQNMIGSMGILEERIKYLEALNTEKDARITELKERIEELKSK